ncbi:TIGR03885 family FMN-dependent LLM class oxidoreductase [Jannaschia rubra]|uniref:F420-dependent glucose-6-phosphate dehydrogenase n=1 Tax=Jannaschia rubra TaxID=282197 RepID=A0A0M6XLF1_9RHOB|nr:TIGR03885 family FMN-dependent LLM class oxidoreductase [Jannaschia rubra]CTQ31407.1 F420-dependent glucose-6-phosphate dehydrogenase [Jannaschia rubra]SFF80155.1 probable non-F420 flavinoid oxidoreductase [Jannaschia rubra]
MTVYGYHNSHEQFAPARLLSLAKRADAAGFRVASASDHFHPWSEAEQGQSGFVWSWLGAAMEATSLSFRTVSCPGWRYHPAILAQAGATLSAMYPERLWMALGSGQLLNEGIAGVNWPAKDARNAHLLECVEVMRALWAGETVTHRGRVTVEGARLYSRPEVPPLAIGAAVSEATARWCGTWADGLITVGAADRSRTRAVIDAFREGGGEGKPVCVQAKIGWDETRDAALEGAWREWRTNILPGDVPWEIRTPRQFQEATCHVTPEDVASAVFVSEDLDAQADHIRDFAEMGADEVMIHNVAPNQEAFIDAFGDRVLPRLKEA